LTETQERFLRAVLERVDAMQVAECHLFPPIRRGTLETGVAVLAVLHAAPDGTSGDTLAADAIAPAVAAGQDADTVPPLTIVASDDASPAGTLLVDDEYASAPDLGMAVDGDAMAIAAALEEPGELDAPVDGDALTIAAAEGVAPDVDAPVDGDALTIAAAGGVAPEVEAPVADEALDIASAAAATPPDAIVEPRARIITASYRQVIKGPERGGWVVDVQEQAEAPLSAVEAVLRGVRQRSSEPADPESVPPALLRQLVGAAATTEAIVVPLPASELSPTVAPAAVADAA
jgi:hypothetical protein